MNHPLVTLARRAVAAYVKTGKIIPQPENLTAEMQERAGVFVSLHLKNGALRGCIGTFAPTRKNVAEEVIHNAIEAATRDPRFNPVQAEELEAIDISVDVLTDPVLVEDQKELNPKKYGVIVRSGGRTGLLLPDLEGVDTVEEQLGIARRKAGIPLHQPVELFKFEVRRYH